MYQDILLDLSVIFILVFALSLSKNKKLAWLFLIVAYIIPFIIEYLNYGLYELPKGYYTYVLAGNAMYLFVAIFGLLNSYKLANLEIYKTIKTHQFILGFIGVIVVYSLINLASFDFIVANMQYSPLLTSLMIVQDILFVYGLILVGLNYRAGLLFLALGQLILVLPIISFMAQYDSGYYFYFRQSLYVVINVVIGASFLKVYSQSMKIKK